MGPGTDSLKPELPKNRIYSSSPGAATTSCTQDVQLFLCLEMSGYVTVKHRNTRWVVF